MKNTLCCVIVVLCFAACKKSDDPSVNSKLLQLPKDVPGNSITLGTFPLQVGNEWLYHIKKQTYWSGDTGEIKEYDFKVWVDSTFMINGTQVYRMRAYTTFGELFLADDESEHFPSYYIHTNAGLYYMPSFTQLDTAGAFMVMRYQSGPWTYQQTGGTNAYRETAGFVKVTTPVKTFDCLKINGFTASIGYAGKHVQQYFSDKGLIQQTQTYEALTPDRGMIYSVKVMTLQSVNF